MKLFNEFGELVNERAIDQCTRIGTTAQQQLECLADSGVTATGLQAYAFALLLEVVAALETVLVSRKTEIVKQEGSKEAETDSENTEKDSE